MRIADARWAIDRRRPVARSLPKCRAQHRPLGADQEHLAAPADASDDSTNEFVGESNRGDPLIAPHRTNFASD